ncbi:hypothetical protein BS47DRAFT_1009050 [Hydnum rufescens UP504]|uniref:Uncharacterized protein n=1 Tax=Hydnum rufescens UP504 TaxID=1448309 RepID=A0A9P6B900_9AGAM|nr:hypothetical protein BS47DRAFT_1009050 [Hydnum rufescens UP504]
MVSLSLVQPKAGNTAVKFWPHTGHLGLTPVVLGGYVRVRPDFDGSQRSLLASAVTISLRCYEARLGRLGILRTNVLFDHSQTLWSSTSHPYEELPQTDWPFSIILPPSAAGGQSSCHFQTYRVYWRIEATIHHAAAPGIGKLHTKHHDVALIRHESSPIASPSPSPIIVQHPLVHSFSVQCVTPSKLAISLKRVIELYDDNNASPSSPVSTSPNRLHPPTPSPPPCHRQLSPYDSPVNATSRCQIRDDDTQITLSDMEFEDDETTNTLVTDDADSLQPLSPSTIPVASKSSRHLLLQELSSFPRSPIPTSESPWRAHDQFGAVGDTYSQQVTMHIPAPKSKSHWAVGQSMQTAMARVKFVLSCKRSTSSLSTR